MRLKLDIDGSYGKRKRMEIAKRLSLIKRFMKMKIKSIQEEKSRHGYHIWIDFESEMKLDDRDIVFLQLLLLSDWKREVHNWFRVKNKMPYWNVLFKEKIK